MRRNEKRVGLSFSPEEFKSVDESARLAHLRRSTFIQKIVLDYIGYIPATETSDSGSTNDVDSAN